MLYKILVLAYIARTYDVLYTLTATKCNSLQGNKMMKFKMMQDVVYYKSSQCFSLQSYQMLCIVGLLCILCDVRYMTTSYNTRCCVVKSNTTLFCTKLQNAVRYRYKLHDTVHYSYKMLCITELREALDYRATRCFYFHNYKLQSLQSHKMLFMAELKDMYITKTYCKMLFMTEITMCCKLQSLLHTACNKVAFGAYKNMFIINTLRSHATSSI